MTVHPKLIYHPTVENPIKLASEASNSQATRVESQAVILSTQQFSGALLSRTSDDLNTTAPDSMWR